MNDERREPRRWSDGSGPDGTLEGAVGAALRRVKVATAPSDAAVAALRSPEPAQVRRAPVSLIWRIVFAAVLLSTAGGAVGAVARLWLQRRAPPSPVVAPSAAGAARPRPAHAARLPLPSPVVEAPAEAPLAETQPPRANPPRPHPSAVTLAPEPVDESEVLGGAFRALRTEGDAARALRALDEYDRRFPTGVLRVEARVARAEALMAQDRRPEALRLLSGLAETDGALTRGVRITRGELHAEAGRCAEAVRDFDRVLAGAADDAAGGRALYGRASCRLSEGNVAGARLDLESYLSLHADGPFAAAARRALDSLP